MGINVKITWETISHLSYGNQRQGQTITEKMVEVGEALGIDVKQFPEYAKAEARLEQFRMNNNC